MSPESSPARTQRLNLSEFVYSQNSSWSLTPKGKLFLELVQINRWLANVDNRRVTFAISPQQRQGLIEKRRLITQSLDLDEVELNSRKLNNIATKITKELVLPPIKYIL